MSTSLLKRIAICAFAIAICIPSAELLAQAPVPTPGLNCRQAKKDCKTAVKRAKKDTKTQNKESKKLEKISSSIDRYNAKRDDCIQNIQQQIDNMKINAQPYAEMCGGANVAQAVNNAQIWTTAQLSDPGFSEAAVLAGIDNATATVIRDLGNVLSDYVANLTGLPTECTNIRGLGDVDDCIRAALLGKGCSQLEQCGYISVPIVGNVELPGHAQLTGKSCTDAQNACKAQKEAELRQQQEQQKAACNQIGRIVRTVAKKGIDVKRCEDRRTSAINRINSKILASKTRYCTAQANYIGVTKPDENTKCGIAEAGACNFSRPYYDGPETTTISCS